MPAQGSDPRRLELLARLEAAWRHRETLVASDALRVFHGPGEGKGTELEGYAIERFTETSESGASVRLDHYWVTEWEASESAKAAIAGFLASRGAASAVILERPRQGIPNEPGVFLGNPPAGRFPVREGEARFLIQLLDSRHPGLFLDHFPLRQWLEANSRGLRVLNTFAYTGSLSVASGIGGAESVTTLDLSGPTVRWAEENWKLNGLAGDSERGRFLFGDVFEWLPRLARRGERFDCVILDPPSFSRGKKGSFSTARDLRRLHELALACLDEKGGWLITSINSANVSRVKYRDEVEDAAHSCGRKLTERKAIALPPSSFPGDDYLKGWIFQVSGIRAPSSLRAGAPRS